MKFQLLALFSLVALGSAQEFEKRQCARFWPGDISNCQANCPQGECLSANNGSEDGFSCVC